MSEKQMRDVGVTAGVKKVIAAVTSSMLHGGTSGGHGAAKGDKRKGAAAPTDVKQRKLSSFFSKKGTAE